MKVLTSKHNPFIDVFTEDGWDTWTRYIKKNKVLIKIKGAKLSSTNYQKLLKLLNKD